MDPSGSFHAWKVKAVLEHRAFDVQAWYSRLSSVTFPTQFAPLLFSQAEAIIVAYQHRFCSRRAPTAEESAALAQLQHTIGELMGTDPRQQWFVRLSSRSPKDAGVVSRSQHTAALTSRLSAATAALPADATPEARDQALVNARLLALFDASWTGLRVRSRAGIPDEPSPPSPPGPPPPRPLPGIPSRFRMPAHHAPRTKHHGCCALPPTVQVDDAAAAVSLLLNSERVFCDLLTAVEARELYDMQVCVAAARLQVPCAWHWRCPTSLSHTRAHRLCRHSALAAILRRSSFALGPAACCSTWSFEALCTTTP
jgi:hypothetical protein